MPITAAAGDGTDGAINDFHIDDGWAARCPRATHRVTGAGPMLDVILIAVTVGFFSIAILYTRACDRL